MAEPTPSNEEIAQVLEDIAQLLEVQDANIHRVRAYREGASSLRDFEGELASLARQDGREALKQIPGIGDSLAGLIREYVDTGRSGLLSRLRGEVSPEDLFVEVPGVGEKLAERISDELEIETLEALEQAAHDGRLGEVEGFGPKRLHSVRVGLSGMLSRAAQRRARRKETVGDIDILATGEHGAEIIRAFAEYEDVAEVQSEGETRSTVRLRPGLQVDLRVVHAESYGAALMYFTGSKEHNIALRNLALERDRKINEYGVFEDDERIAGEGEAEIYALFDMAYIQPELREARGELEAAQKGDLPDLISRDDLRGDLQAHTQASDGQASLGEMARAAQNLGHEYLAITDHSPHIGVAQGLDAEELAERIDEIEALDDELEGIRLLKGVEVDILEDGSLDLPDDILARLDLCVFAVHSHFALPREKQTERILNAMDNPNVHVLAHPTGRIIGEREAYDLDLERVMEGAFERGCFLEINAQPDRLDIDDIACKHAQEMGLKLAISTDAHSTDELEALEYGVHQARRGWLQPEDILNTRPWDQIQDLLER
jgi:DNA polymerase (family 10)